MDSPVCPICGDNASTAKVSAVYRAQTETDVILTSEKISPRPVSFGAAMASVQLAGWLGPPGAPSGEESFVLLGLLASPFAFFWLYLPTKSTEIGLFGALAGIVVGIVLQLRQSAIRGRMRERHRRAMERWESAYYCSRHDIVFLEGDSRTFPPTRFAQLIEEEAA